MSTDHRFEGKLTGPVVELASADSDPQAVAVYIGEMAVELRGLADQSGLAFLAYLLDLVYEESTIVARKRPD